MANGAGLMGEAGPEAVMPLMRMPTGKLGVTAVGGGTKVNVTSVVNNHAANLAGVETNVTDDKNGNITIETLVRPIENALAERMSRGRGSLGLAKRQAVAGLTVAI
jgi:phage-related minor tail protein